MICPSLYKIWLHVMSLSDCWPTSGSKSNDKKAFCRFDWLLIFIVMASRGFWEVWRQAKPQKTITSPLSFVDNWIQDLKRFQCVTCLIQTAQYLVVFQVMGFICSYHCSHSFSQIFYYLLWLAVSGWTE